ncbi:MAG: hypothetical protein NVV62_04590 [Terricaulis sp.]|nr:hypothetical protein [Terricaulis sp.]
MRKIALEEHDVQTSNGPARMSKAEFLVRSIIDRGMRKDATERQMDRALKLLRETGLYDPAPEPGKTGVLVVYPIMEADEWEKATAGELLPKDPLHGIPGAEGLLAEPSAHGRPMPPEEEPP